VDQYFGSLDLFESRAEARNQSMGKVANEAYGIGEQNPAAGWKLQLPEFWVESGKHTGRFEDARLGEGIEEGALAGVSVTDEGDYRNRDCLAPLPLLMADATDCVELGLDVIDTQVDLAAIGLELRLARATGSYAAAKLRHGATASRQARQLVLQLCQLYLKLTFTGLSMAREDVKYELRSVNDVAGQPRLDVPQLRGGEVVIEEYKRRVGTGHGANNLVEFALADEAGGIGPLAALDERCDNGRTS
jgi:hypothetical protein